MENRILDIVEKRYSAVIGNLNLPMLNNLQTLLEDKGYPYVILSSTSTLATHRLGFPHGINEYMGSESFVKLRLQAEIRLINHKFNLDIGNYYLDYVVEWIYNMHVMNTPLNYLDNDGRLFPTLKAFFQERDDLNPNTEDQVAVKLMELISEFYKDDTNLPIIQLRAQVFTRPCVLLICEDSPIKAEFIIDSIKLFHHDFKLLEVSKTENIAHIEYVNFNN